MKTVKEIEGFIAQSRRIDAHVHTHLCDGKPEMTIENIAREAEFKGFDSIILTPHFHKKVTDGERELYEETGATAGKLTYLGKFYTSPAILDETIHMYMAEELSFGDTDFDDDEFIEV